jgi:hypothetical protein
MLMTKSSNSHAGHPDRPHHHLLVFRSRLMEAVSRVRSGEALLRVRSAVGVRSAWFAKMTVLWALCIIISEMAVPLTCAVT